MYCSEHRKLCRSEPKHSARETRLPTFDAKARSAAAKANLTRRSASFRAEPMPLCSQRNDSGQERLKAAPPEARARTTDLFIKRASALTFDLSGPPKAGPLEGRVSVLVPEGSGFDARNRPQEPTFLVLRCVVLGLSCHGCWERNEATSVHGIPTVQAPAADLLGRSRETTVRRPPVKRDGRPAPRVN